MTKQKNVDINSFYWNSLRRFDTVCALCAGLTSKLEIMKQEHPRAIVDIQTIANILSMIIIECEEGMDSFTEQKEATKEN